MMTRRKLNFLSGFIVAVLLILALLIRASLTPQDMVAALHSGQYRQAAAMMQQRLEDGNSLVWISLANLYYLGLGVEQNFRISAKLYSRAAFAGSSDAQINLANQYYQGLGVSQDIRLAFAWFALARDNGNPIAGEYMSEILSEQKLSPQLVDQLRSEYATVNNFPRLHD